MPEECAPCTERVQEGSRLVTHDRLAGAIRISALRLVQRYLCLLYFRMSAGPVDFVCFLLSFSDLSSIFLFLVLFVSLSFLSSFPLSCSSRVRTSYPGRSKGSLAVDGFPSPVNDMDILFADDYGMVPSVEFRTIGQTDWVALNVSAAQLDIFDIGCCVMIQLCVPPRN